MYCTLSSVQTENTRYQFLISLVDPQRPGIVVSLVLISLWIFKALSWLIDTRGAAMVNNSSDYNYFSNSLHQEAAERRSSKWLCWWWFLGEVSELKSWYSAGEWQFVSNCLIGVQIIQTALRRCRVAISCQIQCSEIISLRNSRSFFEA